MLKDLLIILDISGTNIGEHTGDLVFCFVLFFRKLAFNRLY